MDSVTSNVSGIKSRLRSAPFLSSPDPLPSSRVAASGEVSWIPDGEAEEDFLPPEDAMDRDYKTFLNNLTVHGKYYLLEIWMGNPPRLVKLKYEKEGNDEGTGYSYGIYTRTRSGANEIPYADKLFESKNMLGPEGTKVKQEMLLNEYEDSPSESTASSMHSQDSIISIITAHRSYIENIMNREPSIFRNKLIDAISSPFIQIEYENLIVQARKRSPQVKLKHLRSDSIPYQTEILGSSYFDYFPDFAKEVEQADCYKGLALMRGFFFWLKNLGHDGAFKPWFPHL